MRRNNFVLILSSLLLLAFAACSQSENVSKQTANASASPSSTEGQSETSSKAPPADVVRAEASSVEIKAGGKGEASLKLTVANGYHINANPPSFPYLKATELTVDAGEGVTPGKPVYPAGVSRQFAFSKEGPLSVYEGETTIKLPLMATANAKKGAQTLKGHLRIQACNEEACFPPRNLETPIPVTVN